MHGRYFTCFQLKCFDHALWHHSINSVLANPRENVANKAEIVKLCNNVCAFPFTPIQEKQMHRWIHLTQDHTFM